MKDLNIAKRKAIHDKYFNDSCRIRDFSSLSDEEIEKKYEIVLSYLPNDGLLYKYKAFKGKSFEYLYDSLLNGYIYLPRAESLNDRLDTTFLYKTETTLEELNSYYEKNKYKIYLYHVNNNENIKNSIDNIKLSIINLLADGKSTIEILNTVTNFSKVPFPFTKQLIQTIKNEIRDVITKKMAEENIKAFNDLGKNFQKDYRIFSMTEVYNQDSMWAYYCSDNEGVCVCYDFKKAKSLPFDKKKKLLDIHMVEYTNKKDSVNILDVYDVAYGIKKDDDSFYRSNRLVSINLLRKKTSWSQEREWRLVNNSNDEKLYIDIVSKIIIDQSVFDTTKGKKLIKLARLKGWEVIRREFNRDECDYVYTIT